MNVKEERKKEMMRVIEMEEKEREAKLKKRIEEDNYEILLENVVQNGFFEET